MEITDVKVIPVDDEKLKAFVSIVFDQCFVVTDIKIIHGPKGLFVSMPSKKRKDGTFKDIAHPLNNQMRQYLEEKVLTVYRQQVGATAGGPSGAGGGGAGGGAGGAGSSGSGPGASGPGGAAGGGEGSASASAGEPGGGAATTETPRT
jgi:stage V sporulation protein G